MDICADELERARSVLVMIPLGGGLWNTVQYENGSTPAGYTMPTLGTHLALALWPESHNGGRHASDGVTQDVAHEARRAAQATTIAESEGEDAMQIQSRYDHGMGNVMIALAPGDIIITAVPTKARSTSRVHAKLCSYPSPNTHGQRYATPSKPTYRRPGTTLTRSYRLNSNQSPAPSGITRGGDNPTRATWTQGQPPEPPKETRHLLGKASDKEDPARTPTLRHHSRQTAAHSVVHYNT